MAQTSDRVSSIAARYHPMTLAEFTKAFDANPTAVFSDFKALTGTALRQDTTKGLRGKLRKIRKAVGL